jgi:hypothetical protein
MLHWRDIFEISAWNYGTSASKHIGCNIKLIVRGRSFIYIMNNRCPSNDPWGTPCRKLLASSIKSKLGYLRFSQQYFLNFFSSGILVLHRFDWKHLLRFRSISLYSFPVPSCQKMYETVSCKAWGMVLSLENVGSALTIVCLPCFSLVFFP